MPVFDKERLAKKTEEIGKRHTIMIVDDEYSHLHSMESLLSEDYHIITAADGMEALALIQKMDQPQNISVVISDHRMPGISGVQLLEKLKEIIPDTIRIILTAFDEKADIIDAINKAQIYEFILKPFDVEDLKIAVKRCVETFDLKKKLEEYRIQLEHTVEKRTEELKHTKENLRETEKVADRLKESIFSEGPKHPEYFTDIITKSKKMLDIFKYIEAIAVSKEPVLITGETGTGKELIARAIHKASGKKEGNFVSDNVARGNDNLLEDRLYGHEKGGYTGAINKRDGLLKKAENGMLFLDEIGDLDLNLQSNLLRLIQDKKYSPIGSDIEQTTNARFIFATNKNINDLKEKGNFRNDLFFRLNTYHIKLPPLRERKEDILPLVEHFLEEAAKESNKEIPLLPGNLLSLLYSYHFPGNIRELRSMVFEAVSLHQPDEEQELSLNIFIKKIEEQGGKIPGSISDSVPEPDIDGSSMISFGDPFPQFYQLLKFYTHEAMRRAKGNQTQAAKLTGLERPSFLRYLKNPEYKKPKDKTKESD